MAANILGTLCGCVDAEKLDAWAGKEEKWLRTFLELPDGIASQDTYLRILVAIKPEAFRAVFQKWLMDLAQLFGLKCQVAIDGKAIRCARVPGTSQSPVHILSVLACEEGLVIGQARTEEKSDEITALPQLLNTLHLDGILVSADAMACQVQVAQTIVDGNGDYLFGLKGNQPTINKETKHLFEEAADKRRRAIDEMQLPAIYTEEHVDGGHGRIETRIASVCYEYEEWLLSLKRFQQCRTLIQIEAIFENNNTGKTTHEKRHYISGRKLSTAEANEAVRAHWKIKNTLHWCLDVTFNEDSCRVRTGYGAENFNLIRKFAFCILKAFKEDNRSIQSRRTRCDYYMDYRLKVLSNAGS